MFTYMGNQPTTFFESNVWITKSSAYTANPGDKIIADTSGGAFSITLPASPNIGDSIEFIDANGTHDTNNLTILKNGENIMGIADDLTCNKENERWSLTYIDSSNGWKVNY